MIQGRKRLTTALSQPFFWPWTRLDVRSYRFSSSRLELYISHPRRPMVSICFQLNHLLVNSWSGSAKKVGVSRKCITSRIDKSYQNLALVACTWTFFHMMAMSQVQNQYPWHLPVLWVSECFHWILRATVCKASISEKFQNKQLPCSSYTSQQLHMFRVFWVTAINYWIGSAQ